MVWVLVTVGSAFGGVARYTLSLLALRWLGPAFPWGTLLVNCSGALAIGAYFATVDVSAPALQHLPLWQGLSFGFLGGYTTFSSFSLEVLFLSRNQQWVRALLYVASSVVACVAAAALGYYLASTFSALL